jgi:hypothetical protein
MKRVLKKDHGRLAGVSPTAVFGKENHGRDARDTGLSRLSILDTEVTSATRKIVGRRCSVGKFGFPIKPLC